MLFAEQVHRFAHEDIPKAHEEASRRFLLSNHMVVALLAAIRESNRVCHTSRMRHLCE